MNELRNYQREDAETMASKRFFLNASELGTGKTATSLTAATLIGAKRVLIICPSSLKLQWQREICKWVEPPHSIQIVYNGKEIIEPFGDATYYVIINYELILFSSIFYSCEIFFKKFSL